MRERKKLDAISAITESFVHQWKRDKAPTIIFAFFGIAVMAVIQNGLIKGGRVQTLKSLERVERLVPPEDTLKKISPQQAMVLEDQAQGPVADVTERVETVLAEIPDAGDEKPDYLENPLESVDLLAEEPVPILSEIDAHPLPETQDVTSFRVLKPHEIGIAPLNQTELLGRIVDTKGFFWIEDLTTEDMSIIEERPTMQVGQLTPEQQQFLDKMTLSIQKRRNNYPVEAHLKDGKNVPWKDLPQPFRLQVLLYGDNPEALTGHFDPEQWFRLDGLKKGEQILELSRLPEYTKQMLRDKPLMEMDKLSPQQESFVRTMQNLLLRNWGPKTLHIEKHEPVPPRRWYDIFFAPQPRDFRYVPARFSVGGKSLIWPDIPSLQQLQVMIFPEQPKARSGVFDMVSWIRLWALLEREVPVPQEPSREPVLEEYGMTMTEYLLRKQEEEGIEKARYGEERVQAIVRQRKLRRLEAIDASMSQSLANEFNSQVIYSSLFNDPDLLNEGDLTGWHLGIFITPPIQLFLNEQNSDNMTVLSDESTEEDDQPEGIGGGVGFQYRW